MDTTSERCGACGAPRQAGETSCLVCGAPLEVQARSAGVAGRVARAVVGIVGGVALVYVGLLVSTSRDGDPLQGAFELAGGIICLALGGLTIAFAITQLRGPRRLRGR